MANFTKLGVPFSPPRAASMIKHFQINNFKSLVDFMLREGGGPAKFTCHFGENGAGKFTSLN
jgi:DNA repair exonuclease SbcCD ATPase subunit